jgi:hypothetical protein
MTEAKPKRRWFRFSLRTFLVIVTLIGVWLGLKINEARDQKQAVEAIQANGGTVLYDFEVDSNGEAIQPNPAPGWLAKWIGVDYVHNVVCVSFPFVKTPGFDPGQKVYEYDEVVPYLENLPHVFDLTFSKGNLRDGDLRYIASLTSLKTLWIADNPITGTGFKHLLNLKRLTWIDLIDCPIDDDGMEFIAKFPHFEKLGLVNTRITDDGVDQLRNVASIKILQLDGMNTITTRNKSRITDRCIDTLSKIAGLNAVGLTYTLITADGIQRLSELKPSLEIGCLQSQVPPHPGKNVNPR